MEKWKTIKGFDKYEISDLGNVRNKSRGNLLKGGKDRNGYKCVNLRANNKTYFRPIHRFVALNFLKHVKNKTCVNHKDHNKENNNLENLEFCNYHENNTHMKRRSKKSSKYVGVSYCKSRDKYASSIKIKAKHIFLGRFKTEEDAHKAYLSALKEHNIENKYA